MAHIEKRGNSYRIRSSVGYTVNGRQVQPSMTWTPAPGMTPKQVEKEINRQGVLWDEQCRLNGPTNGHIKFEAYAKQWFSDVAGKYLEPLTLDNYHKMETRTYKYLGHLYVDQITPRVIQSFLTSLERKELNERTKKPLSAKTIRNYLGFASIVLASAVKMEMIPTNPCSTERVTPPKETRKERPCYTLEQTQHFVSVMLPEAPVKYQAFFLLAVFGGYRREELCGLEWSDIDFDNHVVTVNRVSLNTKAKGIFTGPPKTAGSSRALKLPDSIFVVLKKLRAEQREAMLCLGDLWQGSGRVFTAENGAPIFPSMPYQWLQRFCKSFDFPFYGVHTFRHTNATLLISEGVNVRTVSAALGHSVPSTTLNIYAHAFASAQAKASDALGDKIPIRMGTKVQ